MVVRDKIVGFLDTLLQPQTYRDACPNGVQVYGKENINRIACCASVSEDFFLQALDQAADLLLVHHGLFWEGSSRVVDPLMARRMQMLLSNEINLLAYHLPLDANPDYGNNAMLAKLMGLTNLDFTFGHYKGTPIGCKGDLPEPRSLTGLADELAEALDANPFVLSTGISTVKKVGVVSGGAGDISMLLEAMNNRIDTYVTGTLFEQSVAIAREAKINVLAIGHYNSEKLGVRAVGDVLAQKLGVEVLHLDVPNTL